MTVNTSKRNNILKLYQVDSYSTWVPFIPDFKSLFDNVHGDERGLEGSKLRLEHAPVCSCVLVSGLKDETTEETIQLYFENKRSGGNVVSKVERETKNSALVYFQDPSSKKPLSLVYRLSSYAISSLENADKPVRL